MPLQYCSLMTVSPHCPQVDKTRFEKILVPTDLSQTSGRAIPYAIGLAKRFNAELTFMTAVHPDIAASSERISIRADRNAQMRAMVPDLDRVEGIEYRVEFETARQAILDTAAEVQADLIVMGVRDSGDFTRAKTHLPGPTAYEVLARATCPVLTIRAKV
jgi:nucleotide-binding universal stress UspA family protein